MIYSLKNDLRFSEDEFKTSYFNKNTVGLSYITLSKNPAIKEAEMAIVAVARRNGNPIHTFSSKVYRGAEYDFIHGLFDALGELTPTGYQYSLDNFMINNVVLREIIDGPVKLG
jgi:hypothetical protein